MNSRDENRILVGLLSEHDPSRLREDSLAGGLKAVRREAARRCVARSAAAISLPLAAALLSLLLLNHAPETGGPASAPTSALVQAPIVPPPVAAATAPSQAPASPPARQLPAVEKIDDAQLLALFADKSVALVGPPGHEQLIVFENGRVN